MEMAKFLLIAAVGNLPCLLLAESHFIDFSSYLANRDIFPEGNSVIWAFPSGFPMPLRMPKGYPVTYVHFPVTFLYPIGRAQRLCKST
jgi:hypothetical protein